MAGHDENLRASMKPACFRGHPMEVGNNRRALGDIKNLMGSQPYPCAISKRGSADRNVVDDENNAFISRRPMTRKFAASLKSQPCSQDSNIVNEQRHNKPAVFVSNSSCFDTSAPIDVDDYKFTNDLPLPMLEETEEMGHPELKEVEMEDVVTDPLLDIDSSDAQNPLEVVDYIEDIYSYYRKMEASGCVCPNYMSNQFDINEKMRALLIDWLIEVHYKFELMHETLFLTVNVIDRFLARQAVARKKLQLVGVTAMLLACKYEEVSVPEVEDLILISDRAYTREEVLEMEKLMANTLQFNMSMPTPYVFMRRFLKAAQSEKKLELLAFFIVELCLVEYEMLNFQPSMLAAAAIYTAQCTLKGFRHWSRTSELHTSYSEDQLQDCSKMMVNFHQKAGMGKLTGVHRKYSTSKFGCTTISKPAMFLLESVFRYADPLL